MSQSPSGPDRTTPTSAAAVPPPELLALGRCLSRGRGASGLSVEELAGQLNMGMEQLQALEEGDLTNLPEPVFIIAQARRVASHLQLNAEEQIQALRQALTSTSSSLGGNHHRQATAPLPSETPAETSSPGLEPAPGGGAAQSQPVPRPAGRLGRILAFLALLSGLGTLGALLGSGGWRQWQTQWGPQLQALQLRLPKPSLPPALAPWSASPPRSASGPETPPGPGSAPATPTEAAAARELVLSTTEGPSWLEVKTLEGEPVFSGTFEGRRRFPLGRGLKVLAGRADLVQVQLGKAPARPLGTIEEVNWQIFTPDSMGTADPTAGQTSRPPNP